MPLHLHRNAVAPGVRDELDQLLRDDGVLGDLLIDELANDSISRGLRRQPRKGRPR